MKKAILSFLIFYTVLILISSVLVYFDILPQKLSSSLNVGICMAVTYLSANAFVNECKRVPTIKERFIFALSSITITEIIGFVIMVFFVSYISQSFHLRLLIFLAIVLLTRFLVIFYIFGFFGKIVLKSMNKNSLN